MKPFKIVVLGGSGVATPELATALTATPGRIRPLELVLVGRSAAKLETVAGISRLMAGPDPLLTIQAETDLPRALSGADLVLNQIRVGGLEARVFDESFPRELGLPGEETVGPGGFANASRTIPVVLEYVRQIEQHCPQATLLTFANPSSLVQYAITSRSNLRTIGLCDGPLTLAQNIAAALGVDRAELVVDYFGMHHFGWVNGVWQNGKDRLADVLQNLAVASPAVDPAIGQTLGVVPGLYHNYFFHPEVMLAKKQGKPTRAEELLELQDSIMEDYAASLAQGKKPTALTQRKAIWYQAVIAPVMLALAEGWNREFVLNLPNNGLAPWLPPETIVETPARIDGGTIRPLRGRDMPLAVRSLIQKNAAYEMLAVEAILERDERKALGALLLNPMIRTFDQAVKTLQKAWSWGR